MRPSNTKGWASSLFVLAGVLVLTTCSDNSITGPPQFPLMTQGPSTPLKQGIPADQMQWVSWKPEIVKKIKGTLAKAVVEGEMIEADEGGSVENGDNVFNIFPGCLARDTQILLKVQCEGDEEECGAGVEGLPNRFRFQKPIEVIMSWAGADVDYQGGELNFKVYYSEDGGRTWHEVEDVAVDYDEETITFLIDHFTRFAWSL